MEVSWDDEIPNIWKNKIHVPNHQPDCVGPWENPQLPAPPETVTDAPDDPVGHIPSKLVIKW